MKKHIFDIFIKKYYNHGILKKLSANSDTIRVIIFDNNTVREQLIVKVDNQEKAQMLSKILTALDFVNSLEIMEYKPPKTDEKQDFFSLLKSVIAIF